MNEELKIIIRAEIEELKRNMKEAQSQISETAESSSKLNKIGTVMKNVAATVAATAAAAFVAVAAGVTALVKKSIESYAEYEQLVGGVETLFKDSASVVQNYANNAFRTAGLSANEYMATVTSFSASLLQSLGGDTAAAAAVADMAIIDMADNANKMGTSMESIQNAYQGFAKQNYTMLDNLKLGYGGTKEEMQRLLADATALSGIEYDINNLNDVYTAIHVIQEELGVAGTTAKEASSTIQGSLASMKAAWSNLVTGLADENADFDALLNNFIDTVVTFGENLIPRIEIALGGVVKLIEGLAPKIVELLPQLVTSILPKAIAAVKSILDSITAVLPSLIQAIMDLVPDLISAILGAVPDLISAVIDSVDAIIKSLADTLPKILATIGELIPEIIQTLIDAIPVLIEGTVELLMAIVEAIPLVIPPLIAALPQLIDSLITTLVENIPVLIDGALSLYKALIDAIPIIIPEIIDALPQIINSIVDALVDAIPMLLEGYIDMFMAFVDAIPVVIPALIEAIGGLIKIAFEHFLNLHTKLQELFEKIKTMMSEKMQQAKDKVAQIFDAIRSAISEKITAAKDKVNSVFTNIKDGITQKITDAKTSATNLFENIKSSITTKINAAKESVLSIFDNIKNGIKTKITDAKNTVGNIIDTIKGFFNFQIKWPNIPMPHFGISPSGWSVGDLLKGSIPKLSIQWYATGAVFDEPTLFSNNGVLSGLGEKGAEAIVPLDKDSRWINFLKESFAGGSTPIVLTVDGKVFAQTAISTINQQTKQTGKLDLVLA